MPAAKLGRPRPFLATVTADKPLLLDEQLCFAVYSTALAMGQVYKPLLQKLHLTYPQYLVMLTLWERDAITAKELAQRLHQDPGSITPLLKRLEQEGYLLRQRDANDERHLSITLTPQGRRLLDKARAVNQEFGLACSLQDEEVTRLRGALAALRDRLQQVAPPD
jgi:MarR family transcriptional regulator, organic hydroperoxide resistance regulator